MRTRLTTALVAAGTIGLGGCGGERPEMPLGVVLDEGQGGSFVVQVSDTTGSATPTYDWGGSAARDLIVVRISDGVRMWQIAAVDPATGFQGPVQHGLQPPGAREVQAPTFLTDGVEFSVQVTTVGGLRGTARFTS